MKNTKLLIIFCFAASISACNKDSGSQTKLYESQRNVLDQAKQVDSKMQQQTQDLQQNLDKQAQ